MPPAAARHWDALRDPRKEDGFFDAGGIVPSAASSVQGPRWEVMRLITQRNMPGVVLIDPEGCIRFSGGIPKALSGLLRPRAASESRNGESERLIAGLRQLRNRVLHSDHSSKSERRKKASHFLFISSKVRVSCRGLALKSSGTETLVLVLIEHLPQTPRQDPASASPFHLTPREAAVAGYIRTGLTNKEIAVALEIGVHTIKDHVKRIMNKMKVHTRSGIAGRLAAPTENPETEMRHGGKDEA